MVELKIDLMKMTVRQLKDELAARGAPRTGQLKSQVGASWATARTHHFASRSSRPPTHKELKWRCVSF